MAIKQLFLSAALSFLSISLLAENLIFNGSFDLGVSGFAMERRLRTDSNTQMEFLPLKVRNNILEIRNPYGEFSLISSKDFKLKKNTKYRLSAEIRADKPKCGLSLRVFTASKKNWYTFGRGISLGVDWKNLNTNLRLGTKTVLRIVIFFPLIINRQRSKSENSAWKKLEKFKGTRRKLLSKWLFCRKSFYISVRTRQVQYSDSRRSI